MLGSGREAGGVDLIQFDAARAFGDRVAHEQIQCVVDSLDVVLPHRPAVTAGVLQEGIGQQGACRGHNRFFWMGALPQSGVNSRESLERTIRGQFTCLLLQTGA